MKPGSAILLRCLLAFAMVTGSIPALSVGDMLTSSDIASEETGSAPDVKNSECHSADSETSPESTSSTSDEDCCSEKGDGCTHENCNCVCPALTIVVPTRSAPAALTNVRVSYSALTVPAPQKVITTPLRPPRA